MCDYSSPVRWRNRFWPFSNRFSGAARGVCVDAVLGQPHGGWVPQPPHDAQTHDQDKRPHIPVRLRSSTNSTTTFLVLFVFPSSSCRFLFHSGYVSWPSFSPAVRNRISSMSWWTTVGIMSMLLSRSYCHCFSKDWARGFTWSPTPSLLSLRWEWFTFRIYNGPHQLFTSNKEVVCFAVGPDQIAHTHKYQSLKDPKCIFISRHMNYSLWRKLLKNTLWQTVPGSCTKMGWILNIMLLPSTIIHGNLLSRFFRIPAVKHVYKNITFSVEVITSALILQQCMLVIKSTLTQHWVKIYLHSSLLNPWSCWT